MLNLFYLYLDMRERGGNVRPSWSMGARRGFLVLAICRRGWGRRFSVGVMGHRKDPFHESETGRKDETKRERKIEPREGEI